MSFPNKIKKWWGSKNDGWEDLGKARPRDCIENGQSITKTTCHTFCGNPVNIGRENNELFKFCNRCLIKITEEL